MRTVIVVGAGHAGLEAAFAAARVGLSASGGAGAGRRDIHVRVITGRVDTIGQTPCNPSVGGVAKGHLVKEIEALGGFMGRAADACAIHGRVLNRSKGPAVRSTRLQVDKQRYGEHARAALLGAPGIELIEGLVAEIVMNSEHPHRVAGVRLGDDSFIPGDAVVITTGTFLGGVLHTGKCQTPGGRVGEAPATSLSQQLASLGFRLSRLKTGTPPRLDGRTIDYTALECQPTEDPVPRFTALDEPELPALLPQVHCHLTWTQPSTHEIITANLHESPMFSGQIKGRGPRYCPSIEDKVVRFAHRDRHQVFLEPEGLDTISVYPNGISTSLAAEVQQAFLTTIPGLERVKMLRPGYAVEYDAIDARSLTHALGSKDYDGLFFAGQVNGTSGYEEAGAQGLVAGANAAAAALGRAPLLIGRDQGYTGVLIDDLVTQGCDEPYRMFTSRAEYRIILREDNAEARLSSLAFEHNLIDAARHDRVQKRNASVRVLVEQLERDTTSTAETAPAWLLERARAERLYAGYLDRMHAEIERVRGNASNLPLRVDLDYHALPGLSHEARARLAEVRPTSIDQAARIPGITPAAVMCLWAHARQHQRAETKNAAL